MTRMREATSCRITADDLRAAQRELEAQQAAERQAAAQQLGAPQADQLAGAAAPVPYRLGG